MQNAGLCDVNEERGCGGGLGGAWPSTSLYCTEWQRAPWICSWPRSTLPALLQESTMTRIKQSKQLCKDLDKLKYRNSCLGVGGVSRVYFS